MCLMDCFDQQITDNSKNSQWKKKAHNHPTYIVSYGSFFGFSIYLKNIEERWEYECNCIRCNCSHNIEHIFNVLYSNCNSHRDYIQSEGIDQKVDLGLLSLFLFGIVR